MKFAALAFGAAALAAAASACVPAADGPEVAAAASGPRGTAQLRPEYDAAGTLRKLEYDRNHDGKVDAWGYMDGARVVRVEVDENGDGRIDRWEYHRTGTSGGGVAREAASSAAAAAAALPGVDRTVERIERATKLDGKVSRKEFFENGLLTTIEEDTDGDGRIDKWETYRNGSLALLALDTQGRGTPDRRLVYGLDGAFDHMETDASGSGRFTTAQP